MNSILLDILLKTPEISGLAIIKALQYRTFTPEFLIKLLEKGADVSSINSQGDTMLTTVCKYDTGHSINMMNILVDKGANINMKDGNWSTPLIWASYQGNTEMVKALIQRGALLDLTNSMGETALSISVSSNHYDIANILINSGANVNEGSEENFPLFIAIKNSMDTYDISIVELLLDNGADKYPGYSEEWNPLRFLVEDGSMPDEDTEVFIDIASAMVCKGLHEGVIGENVLRRTAEDGRILFMELLLDNGVNPNISEPDNPSPLYLAAENGRTEAVELLLSFGANIYTINIIEDSSFTALDAAIRQHDDDTVKVLRLVLLMSRFRSYSRAIGRFMKIYRNVVEIRYAPGGPGYSECIENFEKARVTRTQLP